MNKDQLKLEMIEMHPDHIDFVRDSEMLEVCRQVAQTLTLIQKDKYAQKLVEITRELNIGESRPAYLSWFVVVNASWEQHAQAIRFAKNLPG